MSAYVKKVNFKLHDSYANANRTLTKPPYEVTETGWGEFEIVIKIYFQDPSERPVTIYHILKLFQTGESIFDHYTLWYIIQLYMLIIVFSFHIYTFPGQPTDHNSLMKNQRTVVSEFYDEIIFQVYEYLNILMDNGHTLL